MNIKRCLIYLWCLGTNKDIFWTYLPRLFAQPDNLMPKHWVKENTLNHLGYKKDYQITNRKISTFQSSTLNALMFWATVSVVQDVIFNLGTNTCTSFDVLNWRTIVWRKKIKTEKLFYKKLPRYKHLAFMVFACSFLLLFLLLLFGFFRGFFWFGFLVLGFFF